MSQVYGQALAGARPARHVRRRRGPDRGRVPGAPGRNVRRVRRLPGHPALVPRRYTDREQRRTHAALVAKLRGTGITVSDPAPAVDVNGFYVSRKTARKYKLRTVSDLAKVASKLTIGAPPECPVRPLCLGDASQRAYGLKFADVVPIDPAGSATQRALADGSVDVAVLFTGSSVLPTSAVLLRDDKGLQPADNPVLVLRVAAATTDNVRVANAVSASVTTDAYNDMSLAISRDRQDPTEVAARFLTEHSLP